MRERTATKVKRYSTANLMQLFSAEYDDQTVARMLNVNRVTVGKWRREPQMISEWYADELAIGIGMHPIEIWSDWLDEIV
jgi:hypothetical protein